MPKEPETLKVSVSENIKMKDVPPGTQAPTPEQLDEHLPSEEVEKRRKIMLEYTRLSGRYCPPHNIKSKWVTEKDLEIVIADGKDLVAMCGLPRGKYSGIMALTHSQINDKDPLRFFVFPNGVVVINPVVINHTKSSIEKAEGCMSYPELDVKKDVPRYNKITVIYQTLEQLSVGDSGPILSKPILENLSGGAAHVFQHELSHLNGSNIYDKDFKAESCEGLGNGLISEEEALKLYN
jgi:peptide deformylase